MRDPREGQARSLPHTHRPLGPEVLHHPTWLFWDGEHLPVKFPTKHGIHLPSFMWWFWLHSQRVRHTSKACKSTCVRKVDGGGCALR